jgi:hypothetical protein
MGRDANWYPHEYEGTLIIVLAANFWMPEGNALDRSGVVPAVFSFCGQDRFGPYVHFHNLLTFAACCI